MGFRSPKIILRELPGTYDAPESPGIWVPGERTSFPISASVQPFSIKGEDLLTLPEGRLTTDYVVVYTTAQLLLASPDEKQQPDIIIHNGRGFELVSSEEHSSGVIPHFKYVGYLIFQSVTWQDWIAGRMERKV